jgi:DNA-binding NarL/FixJ family response regulator
MATRLVLAEDSYLMREGITSLLDLEDSLELVATCESFDLDGGGRQAPARCGVTDARRVGGDADHFEVVLKVEERLDALAKGLTPLPVLADMGPGYGPEIRKNGKPGV